MTKKERDEKYRLKHGDALKQRKNDMLKAQYIPMSERSKLFGAEIAK